MNCKGNGMCKKTELRESVTASQPSSNTARPQDAREDTPITMTAEQTNAPRTAAEVTNTQYHSFQTSTWLSNVVTRIRSVEERVTVDDSGGDGRTERRGEVDQGPVDSPPCYEEAIQHLDPPPPYWDLIPSSSQSSDWQRRVRVRYWGFYDLNYETCLVGYKLGFGITGLTRFLCPRDRRLEACCCPVCHSLILSFCPPLWNFNLANNFWTVSARALKFHMNIPCD